MRIRKYSLMRLTKLRLKTMELETNNSSSARAPHIERLVDKAHQPNNLPLSTKRSALTTAPQPAFKQYRWTTPPEESPQILRKRVRGRMTASDLHRLSTKRVRLLPRVKSCTKHGIGVLLRHTDLKQSDLAISWERFKPVTPLKVKVEESRLISKLMLSGLIVTH